MTESVAPTTGRNNTNLPEQNFPADSNITITFLEAMDPSTVTINTICVREVGINTCLQMTSGDPTTNDNITFTFNPSNDLIAHKRTYTLTITTDVKDTSGNSHTGTVIQFATQ